LDTFPGTDNVEIASGNFSQALLAEAEEIGPQFYRSRITGFSAEAGSFNVVAVAIGGGDFECRLAGAAVTMELTLKAGELCVHELAASQQLASLAMCLS